jgi:hypothetical protein
MAPFTSLEENNHALDWEILRDGGICLYRRNDYLQQDIDWLVEHGYQVYSFDCSSWISEQAMHDQLASLLSFPAYYGKNFNALHECLTDDLVVPDEGGTIFLLDRFDVFAKRSEAERRPPGRVEAEVLLDIVARASRHFLSTGRRLIALVRSDDPLLHFEGLGSVHTCWNRREWLNKNRGL